MMTKRKQKSAFDLAIDNLLNQQETWDAASFGDMFQNLKKSLMERVLEREMDVHSGHPRQSTPPDDNRRNGPSAKTVITESGPVSLDIPRDREGDFTPLFVPKHQRRFPEMDQKIIALYARGLSMRDIQSALEDIYGVEVSPELISEITDEVLNTVSTWQNRPLDPYYPILYLDAIHVNIKDSGQVKNKAVYVAVGVNMSGGKEILGLWISQNEGAKFWLQVLPELKNRGVQQIFIACVDGLTGFPDAIRSIFPHTQVQLCIVHMIRNSLKYVPWKNMKAVAKDLKAVYTSPHEEAALQALEAFEAIWGKTYPPIGQMWRRHWPEIVPFLAYPEPIRKAIYTTNAVEAINRQIRKVIKTKGLFPNDQAALKLIFLALQNAAKKWTMPIRDWKEALAQFSILYHDHFPLNW